MLLYHYSRRLPCPGSFRVSENYRHENDLAFSWDETHAPPATPVGSSEVTNIRQTAQLIICRYFNHTTMVHTGMVRRDTLSPWFVGLALLTHVRQLLGNVTLWVKRRNSRCNCPRTPSRTFLPPFQKWNEGTDRTPSLFISCDASFVLSPIT